MPTMLLPFAALALVGLRGVSAQITSNATCFSNWVDLYNSKGQSPCLVGAYLGGACNGGQYDVSALEDGQHYIGPTSLNENDCLCSTVMYSVMGACSTCQNATLITWSAWSANCPDVFVQVFPDEIPADTAVPGWAYESITTNGTFDVNRALSDSSPESTATFVQSTNTGTGTRTSSSATSSASSGTSSSGDNNSDSKSGGSNAGAIAGGVVGGVVGVALLALLGFFLVRRNRNKNAIGGGGSGVQPNLTGSSYQGGMSQYAPVPYTPNAYDGAGGANSPPLTQQKLYDPNDPSTFPTSPVPNTLHSQGTGQSYTPSFPQASTHGSMQPMQPSNQGMYRGVAEV